MLNNASKSTCCGHTLKIKQLHAIIYIVLYRSVTTVVLQQLDNLYAEKPLNSCLQSSYSFEARYRGFLTIFYSVI